MIDDLWKCLIKNPNKYSFAHDRLNLAVLTNPAVQTQREISKIFNEMALNTHIF